MSVNVYERMARILDCLPGLERANSLAMLGCHADNGLHVEDLRNTLFVIEDMIGQARRDIAALADEVREATKPVESVAAAKRKAATGGRAPIAETRSKAAVRR